MYKNSGQTYSGVMFGGSRGGKLSSTDNQLTGYLGFYTNNAGTFAERARLFNTGGFALGSTTDPGAGSFLASGTIAAGTGGSTGHATCWKTGGVLGYCSTQPDSTGACTCN